MTSTIPVKATAHKAIRAQLLAVGAAVPLGDPKIVDKGSEAFMYIHGSQDLHLHEMTDEEYTAWRDSQADPEAEAPDSESTDDEDDDPPE